MLGPGQIDIAIYRGIRPRECWVLILIGEMWSGGENDPSDSEWLLPMRGHMAPDGVFGLAHGKVARRLQSEYSSRNITRNKLE